MNQRNSQQIHQNQRISWQTYRQNVYDLIGEQQANKLKTRKISWEEIYKILKSQQNAIYKAINQMFQEADEESEQNDIHDSIKQMIKEADEEFNHELQ